MQTDTIKQIADELEKANMVYIIGNGGSAALADHFACDLLKNCNIPAISLCSNLALITAIANDKSFDKVFTEQLKVLLKTKKDLLFALSTRGTSPNIVLAARLVYPTDYKVIGVAGYNGGQLKRYCNIFYRIDSNDMQECEDKMVELCHKIYKELKNGRER